MFHTAVTIVQLTLQEQTETRQIKGMR